jgi:hypothetical protein
MTHFLMIFLAAMAADPIQELKGKADKGNAQAMFELGLRYHKGDGVEKDDKAALEWHQKAAAKDHTKSEVQLGYLHAHGFGTKLDFVEAAKWYRKAAAKGDTTAQHNMGLQSMQGKGVKKDVEQAAQWFQLAAAQGHTRAQFNLGQLYEEGNGVKKDADTALMLYELASAQPEQERIFGKEKAAELVRRRDRLRQPLSAEDRKFLDGAAASLKAMAGVHPRRFGLPGGVGQLRGWYVWESYNPALREAVVVHESKGDRYTVRVLPWMTTYRRLVYGAGPEDLVVGERVNLFFAPSERHERGLLVHYQDEIGQMKGHGHFWEVLSADEKGDRFKARVMAGDKPLDGAEHTFEVGRDCKRWRKGTVVADHRPAKGDRLYLTWLKMGERKEVVLLSDDASLEAIRKAEQERIENRVAKEGLTGHLEIVEENRASVLLFATWWQQAAKLKEGQRMVLACGEERVSGHIVSRKNRGTYGSGPTDVVLELKDEKDALRVRGWYADRDVRLTPE